MRECLLSDLQKRLGTSCLYNWIEEEASALAQLGQQADGYIALHQEVLLARGIASVRLARISAQARIIPDGEQYRIEVRPNLPADVRRLAVAHEIGHTYWFAPGGGGRPLSTMQTSDNHDKDIEFLSDRFAAALLLPRDTIIRRLSLDKAETDVDISVLNQLPEIAVKLAVPERLVAERSVHHVANVDRVVVCVRQVKIQPELPLEQPREAGDYWQLSWCAVPPNHKHISVRAGSIFPPSDPNWKPRIPGDMVPGWVNGGAQKGVVDGRWGDFARILPLHQARLPFKKRMSRPPLQARARRVGDRLYLSIDI